MIEIPEDNKIIVFSKGIPNGSNLIIPLGGHKIPNSIVGFSLEWKNPQNQAKKNIISETINKIIPDFIRKKTLFVCIPWKVASREMSRHHW